MPTELLYQHDSTLATAPVTVSEVRGTTIIILAATIFYPQGGGQPFDTGVIRGAHGTFHVQEVRKFDGVVQHIGMLEGTMTVGEEAIAEINTKRRLLNSRVHSAAHVVDLAVHRLGYNWIPGKGHSFPDGPYVEYAISGEIPDIQQVRQTLEDACNHLVEQAIAVKISFVSPAEFPSAVAHVPETLPGEVIRVVTMDGYGIACGGTHVQTTAEIGAMKIRKLKQSGSTLKVSYEVE